LRDRRAFVGLASLPATLALMLAGTASILGCHSGGQTGPQTTPYLQRIPPAGSLARPKSPGQTGVPPEATRAAIPADNPQTPEKIALGEQLFFDGRLSADGTVACSTCHDPVRAFTDGRSVSVGIRNTPGQRNAPTILNALYNKSQFWDGRARTLEEQAGFPIINPAEMGQPSLEAAVTRIAAVSKYRKAFQNAFGRAPNGPDLLRAIAAYERTQISFESPFDHFIAGDQSAINTSAKRGWALFQGRARCTKCHALTKDKPDVTNFTDHDFHNIGVVTVRQDIVAMSRQAEQIVNPHDTTAVDRTAIQSRLSALGRFLVTMKESDIGAFKTPNLRNLLLTEPYFHDGSHQTLWDVIDHYNKGGDVNDPYLDPDMQPLGLKEPEIDDLVAFLGSLTSPDYREPALKELARQRKLSKTTRPDRDTARAFGPKPLRSELPRG
jgi:cytochrome c peroxidase